MADSVDDANATQAHFEKLQIDKVRHAAQQLEAVATGLCLACNNETVTPGQRWCNRECRDDWERFKKRGLI